MKANHTQKSWLIIPLVWMVWVMCYAWAIMMFGVEWKLAVYDSIISNLIYGALCTGAVFVVRFYKPAAALWVYLIIGAVLLSISSTWLAVTVMQELIEPNYEYTEFYKASFIARSLTGFLLILVFILVGWVIYYNKEQLEEAKRKDELHAIARETELNNLRQQLQPHFIFNTLNSISALAVSNTEGARKMIQQLSDFLRGTLRNEKAGMVSLQQELEHLGLYLAIEETRFGNRLKTEILCGDDALNLVLPPLLLQPLVENAIKFGLYDTLDAVTIHFHASRSENYLEVSLSNPYDEQSSSIKTGTGFGITSAKRKLYLLYGRNDLLQVNSGEGLFTVTVTIPQPQ